LEGRAETAADRIYGAVSQGWPHTRLRILPGKLRMINPVFFYACVRSPDRAIIKFDNYAKNAYISIEVGKSTDGGSGIEGENMGVCK
jgi:hypothetical protein